MKADQGSTAAYTCLMAQPPWPWPDLASPSVTCWQASAKNEASLYLTSRSTWWAMSRCESGLVSNSKALPDPELPSPFLSLLSRDPNTNSIFNFNPIPHPYPLPDSSSCYNFQPHAQLQINPAPTPHSNSGIYSYPTKILAPSHSHPGFQFHPYPETMIVSRSKNGGNHC